MTRIRHFAAPLLVLAALVSAGTSHSQTAPQGTAPPAPQPAASNPADLQRLYPVEVKDQFGFMDSSGRLLIPAKFDGGRPSDTATAWVMLPSRERPRTQSGFTVYPSPVEGFIDRSGKLLFRGDSYPYGGKKLKISQIGPLSDDRAEFQTGVPGTPYTKTGYLDGAGKVAIAPQFGFTHEFSEGLAGVTAYGGMDYSWGFIDKSGAYVIQPQFRQVKSFVAGLAPAQDFKTELWGYIDTRGAYVLKPQFTDAWPFSEGYAVVQGEAGRFLIDRTGKQHGDAAPALGTPAEGLIAFNEGGVGESQIGWSKTYAATGGRWGYRTPEGEVVLSTEFDFANDFSEGLAAVNYGGNYRNGIVDGGIWGYVDRTGRIVIAPQFAEAGPFTGGLARVYTAGSGLFDTGSRSIYIDRAGNEVLPRDPKAPPPPPRDRASERIARELNQKGKEADDADIATALKFYSQAIQADPRFYQAYFNRASILGKQRKWPEAIRDLSTAIALSPQLAPAYQNRGIALATTGELDKAVSDLGKAIQYDPSQQSAYFARILVYIKQNKLDLARQEVTRLQQRGITVPYRIVSILRARAPSLNGSSTELTTVSDKLATMRPMNLQSAEKISGLFVGISNYPGKSPQSGPAHTFGAVLFQEIFYRAEANRLGLEIIRSGIGDFTSEYRAGPDEQVFTTPGGGGWISQTIGMFGRLPQPEIPNLKLIADLRINPRDYDTNPEAVVRLLASIDGSWLQLRDNRQVPVALSPAGQTWPYFGRGDYVSRQKLMTELDAALGRTVQGIQQPQEVFVFYVAAHGGIRRDGKPFLFTANPAQTDERLDYQEILDLIAQKGGAPQGKRLIKIIIFDACQTLESGAQGNPVSADQAIANLQLPPDTILITSTSPGRYAIHLPSAIQESHSITTDAAGLFGAKEENSFDQEFSSTSSAFPVASHLALKRVSTAPTITIDQWAGAIQQSLTSLMPADSPGETQIMTLRRSGPDVATPVLFNVLKQGDDK